MTPDTRLLIERLATFARELRKRDFAEAADEITEAAVALESQSALITKAVEALTRARSFIYERSKLDTDYGMAAETSDELASIDSALSALREGLPG